MIPINGHNLSWAQLIVISRIFFILRETKLNSRFWVRLNEIFGSESDRWIFCGEEWKLKIWLEIETEFRSWEFFFSRLRLSFDFYSFSKFYRNHIGFVTLTFLFMVYKKKTPIFDMLVEIYFFLLRLNKLSNYNKYYNFHILGN
jgi:hypothetical protein